MKKGEKQEKLSGPVLLEACDVNSMCWMKKEKPFAMMFFLLTFLFIDCYVRITSCVQYDAPT